MSDPAPLKGPLTEIFDRMQRHHPAPLAKDAAAAQEAEERAVRLAERLKDIPARYAGARLEHPEANAWVTCYLIEARVDGLLITGPVGTGKTHLMWAIYRAIAEADPQRFGVVSAKMVSLLSRLRPGGDEPHDYVSRLCRAPLLLLDDIGAEKGSEWVSERLYELVDARYEARLPIICTSNRKPEKLAEVVGERVASRLHEMCEVLPVLGGDRRLVPVR
jgi:DNA replication protein DnaC